MDNFFPMSFWRSPFVQNPLDFVKKQTYHSIRNKVELQYLMEDYTWSLVSTKKIEEDIRIFFLSSLCFLTSCTPF